MSSLPPGPTGRYRTTWGILRNPREVLTQWAQTFGDPFLITAMNGPVVVTGKPEYVEQIFRAPPDTYSVFAREAMLPLLGAGSLLLKEGPRHRAERKRVAPPFHGDRMKAYGRPYTSEANQRIVHEAFDAIAPEGFLRSAVKALVIRYGDSLENDALVSR